jgi:hypothetical protein
MPISVRMDGPPDESGKRVERAAFETDRLLVVGDVTLPPEGYQSRFSDSLNRGELEFLPLTDCEVTTLADGRVERREFMVLSKRHIRVAFPVAGDPSGETDAP